MNFKKEIQDSLVGTFKLSNEEFNEIKRTSNMESRYKVDHLGLVFNTFELLKFLSKKI